MWAINTNKCLPQELTVQSVEHILHRIGLTLDSNKTYPKRKLFFNPIIIFLFFSLYIIREVVIISLNEENEITFKMLGSFGYLLGIRKHISFIFALVSFLELVFQLIYYKNYRNGIKPTFLRVFQMMSGLVSPKSLGLTDEQQIRKLLSQTKTLLKYIYINNNVIMPLVAITIMISVFLIKTNLYETICYGIPNAFIYAVYIVHLMNLVIYPFMIFYTNCVYLKMKINSLNERLLEMQRRKRFIRIRETLQSFYSIYSEINEYNTTLYSDLLFWFWNIMGTMIVFLLYSFLFGYLNLITKLMFIYVLCFWSFVFLFIIFTASSVIYCANKSYKTLNSMFISYSKHNKHFYFSRITAKSKVMFNPFINVKDIYSLYFI